MDGDTRKPLGIIAGGGDLPLANARGMRDAGRRVVAVGLRGCYSPELPSLCDRFQPVGLARLGAWIRHLQRFGAAEAVMVGYVDKKHLYRSHTLLSHLPDWRGLRLAMAGLFADQRTDQFLGRVADELASEGVELIDSTTYIRPYLADVGVMTRVQPGPNIWRDIKYAIPVVRQMGGLDIGQSIAVRSLDVIAVEALEGTDRMIERAGQLCSTNWTMVKVAKPNQDMRFDVPTIGRRTIANLKKAGAGALAVEAGKTILLDKDDLLADADAAGIPVVGIRVDDE